MDYTMERLNGLVSLARQAYPSQPLFIERNVPDMTGKVCIVTGANAGVGKEAAQILYSKNATVYIASRSAEKSLKAIEEIKSAITSSEGKLDFLKLDLADLPMVQEAANEFLTKESKLHLLINNAGVGWPEKGSVTKQGIELQVGVNCVGPFLFTQLLESTLIDTAKTSPANSVRIVWVSSSASEGIAPKDMMPSVNNSSKKSVANMYFASKFGNFLHSAEYADRLRNNGIVSVSLNPGNLDSELWRTQPSVIRWILRTFVLYPSVYGAYTTLFAGTSEAVTIEQSGRHIAPWGRLWEVSNSMTLATKTRAEGGSGIGKDFWEWTEAQIERHA